MPARAGDGLCVFRSGHRKSPGDLFGPRQVWVRGDPRGRQRNSPTAGEVRHRIPGTACGGRHRKPGDPRGGGRSRRAGRMAG
jgi:hypothetical protein